MMDGQTNHSTTNKATMKIHRISNSKIMQGGFGEISLGVLEMNENNNRKSSFQLVVLKTLQNGFVSSNIHNKIQYRLSRDAFIEIAALRLLSSGHHQNINSLRYIHVEHSSFSPSLSLALDFCVIDLATALQLRFKPYNNSSRTGCSIPVPLDTVRTILSNLLSAVKHCHSMKVIHRDIKSANILLNSQNRAQLCDFGLAKPINLTYGGNDDDIEEMGYESDSSKIHHQFAKGSEYSTGMCTLPYRAPESLLGCKLYTEGVDIWGVACVALELLHYKAGPVFNGSSVLEQISIIFGTFGTPRREHVEDFDKWYPEMSMLHFQQQKPTDLNYIVPQLGDSPELLDFIYPLMRYHPLNRPSASKCLEHEFFMNKNINQEKVLESILPKDYPLKPCTPPRVFFSKSEVENWANSYLKHKRRADVKRPNKIEFLLKNPESFEML